MTNLADFRVTDLVTSVLAAQYNRVIDSVLRGELTNVETLSANKTLIDNDYPLQVLNPTAARDVTLPAVSSVNHPFYIVNASGTYALTIKNAGGTIIGIIIAGGAMNFASSSTVWYALSNIGAQIAGQLGGTIDSPTVLGLRETGGPTLLSIGAVADRKVMRRSGSSLVGFDTISYDGWFDDSGNIWTYASSVSFSVPGDQTALFKKGMKLKFTQSSTVKYASVTGSSVSTNTLVTIALNSDYSLANSAISAMYYSFGDPIDFPQEFNWAPAWTNLTVGNGTYNAAKFRVQRDRVRGHLELIFGSTTSISGQVSLAAPVASAITHNFIQCGAGALVDASPAYLYNSGVYLASGVLSPRAMNVSGSYNGYTYITSTIPMTWATGDTLAITFDYPF